MLNTKISTLIHSLSLLFQSQSSKTVALAVSGGSDSMALLHICSQITKDFIVIHINHQTRKECQEEALMISQYCQRLGLKFVELKAENLFLEMPNFENEARKERYRLLTQYAQDHHITKILTAHHKDDLIETVFLKILRGSLNIFISKERFLDKEKNILLVRPMLLISKQEIESYLQKNDILYIVDRSNYDKKYLRNFLRLEIFPLLRSKIEHFSNKILSLSQQREDEEDFLFSYTKQQEKDIFDNNTCLVGDFVKEHKIIQQRMIQNKILQFFEKNISRKQVLQIISLISKSHAQQVILFESHQGNMVKENNKIIICKNQQKYLEKKQYIVHNRKTYDFISNWKIEIIKNKGIAFCLEDTLYLRIPNKGERILWNTGSKKISELLIDKKIPLSKRSEVRVIIKNNTLIGILSEEFSYIIPSERAGCDKQGIYIKNMVKE